MTKFRNFVFTASAALFVTAALPALAHENSGVVHFISQPDHVAAIGVVLIAAAGFGLFMWRKAKTAN